MKILLTGSTGYIGRRLKQKLLENDNIELRLMVRNKKSVCELAKKVEIIEGDTFNKDALRLALKDVDTAYYLIHSLSNENYKDLDKISAQNFLDIADECGVKRIIYLGGLGVKNDDTSEHLLSRIETGEILSSNKNVQTIWFEKKFYKDSIFRGILLTLSLLLIVFIVSSFFSLFDNIFVQGFLASFALSSRMLYDVVKDVVADDDIKIKRKKISMLVSRDTSNLSNTGVNKAAIETYGENLSDGVIAPLFYLLCFGIVGAFIYKAINTLDSMVGYRNEKYEKFGKFSARLDDVANFIPSRITAVLISILFLSKKALFLVLILFEYP